VDIADDDELMVKVKAHLLDDSSLRATMSLSKIFPSGPKEDTVHFIIKPSKLLQ